MALAPDEIGITVVGLAFGYWLVSYLLEKRDRKKDASAKDGQNAADSAQRAAEPWWAVLGVAPDASRADIVQAYKRRISEYHPDKVANMGDEIRALAARRAQQINVAYEEALRRF